MSNSIPAIYGGSVLYMVVMQRVGWFPGKSIIGLSSFSVCEILSHKKGQGLKKLLHRVRVSQCRPSRVIQNPAKRPPQGLCYTWIELTSTATPEFPQMPLMSFSVKLLNSTCSVCTRPAAANLSSFHLYLPHTAEPGYCFTKVTSHVHTQENTYTDYREIHTAACMGRQCMPSVLDWLVWIYHANYFQMSWLILDKNRKI